MTTPSVFYKCALCHVFLDNYRKATVHLGLRHSAAALKNDRKYKAGRQGTKAKADGDLITPVHFPEAIMCLKKITLPEKIQKDDIRDDLKLPKARIIRKGRPKGPGRQEIKLDTLKAGEIETLIKDLFQASASGNQESSGHPVIRKSSRKVKERFKRNYGELDSEDLEIIRTGRSSKFKDQDNDSNYSASSSDSEGIKSTRKGKPSSALVRKVPVKNEDGDWDVENVIVNRRYKGTSTTDATGIKSYCCKLCDLPSSFPKKEYLEHMRNEHMENGMYNCPRCDRSFNLKEFNRHMDQRCCGKTTPKPKHKCEVCGREFKYLCALTPHLKVHEKARTEDPSRPFACPVCQHRFANRYRLRRHLFTHLENNPYKCKFSGCDKKFTCDDHLRRHVKLHSADRDILKCDSCPAQYFTQLAMLKHANRFHSNNSSEAPVYRRYKNKRFGIESFIQKPFTTPEGQAQKDGNDSNFRFEVESIHLEDRILTMEDQKDIHVKGETLSPQKIPQHSSARSTGSNVGGLEDLEDEHLEFDIAKTPVDLMSIIRSDPVMKRLQDKNPETANVMLGSIGSYRNHSTHKIKCQLCNWSCYRSYMLQQHMKKSHNEIPAKIPSLPSTSTEVTSDNPLAISLTCGSCGFQSKSSHELSAHMSKVHIRGNKYHCSFCGIRFPTKSRKDFHERLVHLTEKKFCCGKCDAKYSNKLSLQVHMKIKHDPNYKKKPFTFKCEKCARGFYRKPSYTAHLEGHNKDSTRYNDEKKRPTCKICHQTCADAYSLRRHIQYVHLGVKNPYNKQPKKTARPDQIDSSRVVPGNMGATSGSSNPNPLENPSDQATTQRSAGIAGSPEKSPTRIDSSEILGF